MNQCHYPIHSDHCLLHLGDEFATGRSPTPGWRSQQPAFSSAQAIHTAISRSTAVSLLWWLRWRRGCWSCPASGRSAPPRSWSAGRMPASQARRPCCCPGWCQPDPGLPRAGHQAPTHVGSLGGLIAAGVPGCMYARLVSGRRHKFVSEGLGTPGRLARLIASLAPATAPD
jgi:hypothetical protein